MVNQENWRRDNTPAHPAQADVTALGIVQPHLSERDQSFANSLIAQFNARGFISDKQLYWVKELTKRAQTKQAGQPPVDRAAGAQSAQSPASREFLQILALFASAGSRAAIVFHTASGTEFRLSVAGERSQQPGSINVTDAQQGFENRTWFGRITTKGVWQASGKLDIDTRQQVEAALTLFNADPAKAAAEYGHAVGSCCFCRRELTDERSVSVGYGPICAERFSLPWGEVPGAKPKLTCAEVNEAQIPF